MDSKLYSKCEILFEMYEVCKDSPLWEQYFAIYDIGVPLARMIALDCAEPTDEGREAIEEAWFGLCFMMGVDPDGEYESFDDIIQIGELPDES